MKDLDLNTIYKAILETGWLITDEQGMVYRNLSAVGAGEKEPFIMLERAVALPTRENLGRSGRDALLIFHPLMEGLLGGESPVIGKLRRAYSMRYSFTAGALFTSLLGGVNHETEYSKFAPEQMDLLQVLKGATASTLKAWEKLMELSTERAGLGNAFVDVYIKREQTLSGQSYSRVCSVRFPIYNELIKNPDKLFGSKMKLSNTDREVLVKLFEYMYPNIGLEDSYTYGSNARIAPYLDSLLGAFGKLFKITNDIFTKYKDVIMFDPSIEVELAWPEWFRDIESLKNLAQSVPQQYGNFPVKVEDEKRAATGTNAAQLQTARQQPAVPLPQTTQAAQQQQVQQAVQPQGIGQTIGQPQTNAALMPQKPPEVPAPAKFAGIGVPLSNANGVVAKPQISTQAVFIDAQQSARQMLDPATVVVNETMRLVQAGGVGRVSAAAARPVQQNQAFNFQPQATLNGNGNPNGWSTANSNGFGQSQPSVSASLYLRDSAIQMLSNNNPSSFQQMGFSQMRSAI